jgi:sugar/nucleoside kinase (ribokinase family)
MKKDYDVLVVGGVGIDTIVRVPSLPLAAADSIHVGPVRDYVAHTGNGVALALLALGMRTKLIDFIGADPQAELIHQRYRMAALDFSYLIHPSGTRRSVNLVAPDGRRLALYDGRHPDELRMDRSFYLPALERTRHAHFSIMNWARDLYDDAQALGLTVSTDLHDWDGVHGYHRDFAFRSDIVFLSTAALGGADRHEAVMHDILRHGCAHMVIAMAGAAGSYLLRRADAVVHHFPCIDLGRPLIDSNGAGDAFVAAFLHAHLSGHRAGECMRLGSIAGAHACSVAGTAEQVLSYADLMTYAAGAATYQKRI